MSEDHSTRTSSTLLGRLRRGTTDQADWYESVARYEPRALDWCRRWGLQESDAQDVTQPMLFKLSRSVAAHVCVAKSEVKMMIREEVRRLKGTQ